MKERQFAENQPNHPYFEMKGSRSVYIFLLMIYLAILLFVGKILCTSLYESQAIDKTGLLICIVFVFLSIHAIHSILHVRTISVYEDTICIKNCFIKEKFSFHSIKNVRTYKKTGETRFGKQTITYLQMDCEENHKRYVFDTSEFQKNKIDALANILTGKTLTVEAEQTSFSFVEESTSDDITIAYIYRKDNKQNDRITVYEDAFVIANGKENIRVSYRDIKSCSFIKNGNEGRLELKFYGTLLKITSLNTKKYNESDLSMLNEYVNKYQTKDNK